MVVQTEDTTDYVSQDRPVEANQQQQQEPGPPPYESVMMSGYDGVGSDALCILKELLAIGYPQSSACVKFDPEP